jgi:hypothetical protein
MMNVDAFISYSSKDKAAADAGAQRRLTNAARLVRLLTEWSVSNRTS